MVSQSIRDCSEAAGEVSSMYSTPKSERAVALEKSVRKRASNRGNGSKSRIYVHLDLGCCCVEHVSHQSSANRL